MIVDCHGHFNTAADFERNAKKYLKDTLGKMVIEGATQLWKSWEEQTTVEGWLASLDRYGVDKILLQTAPFGSSDAVAKFVKKAPDRFVGLANIDFMEPEESNSVEEMERCVKELGLKGIGELYPKIGPWNPSDEKCFPLYEKAQELDIPIMFHFGNEVPATFGNEGWCDPYMLDTALRQFPGVKFIICHMGTTYVHHVLMLMQSRPNLYAEISSADGPVIPRPPLSSLSAKEVLGAFLWSGLAKRLLWATDVQLPYDVDGRKDRLQGTIKDNPVVKLLEEWNISEEDKANILGENAKMVFKL